MGPTCGSSTSAALPRPPRSLKSDEGLMRPLRVALLLLGLLLATDSAWAQQVGVYVSRPGVTCANDPRLTAPVAGQTTCYDSTISEWSTWGGTFWIPSSCDAAAKSQKLIIVTCPPYNAHGNAATT